jgi:Acetyltransferase (GNAT) domain
VTETNAMTLTSLTPADRATWIQVLEECAPYDFYHLPRYHRMADQAGEGSARLFVFREAGHTIALPLLIRSLDDQPAAQLDWHDATSVYGYAGPVASPGPIPAKVVANFQAALTRQLGDMQVVSVFARLNAFLPQPPLLAGLGECQSLRRTVSIDLTLPVDIQRARYRRNHKEGINRLRRQGVTCVRDDDGRYLGDFVRIYHETMRRVEARDRYHFAPSYFIRLMKNLGTRVHLFVCLHEGRSVCGGLFLECCGVLQYHLGGTLNEALRLAPMKLLLDDVRLWGTERGCRTFHLGGGVGSSDDDPLLHFKRGFSDRDHDFSVWQWILMPDAYRRLCDARGVNADAEFFPAYRCPMPISPLPLGEGPGARAEDSESGRFGPHPQPLSQRERGAESSTQQPGEADLVLANGGTP